MLAYNPRVRALIRMALEEDLGTWDVTSALLPEALSGRGRFMAKAAGVVAGLDVVDLVLEELGLDARLQRRLGDGARVAPGDVIATLAGPTRGLLVAERTALNFLQHLSGVATAVAALVELVAGTRAQVVDTRKTLPGWRALEKYAVTVGGGRNHRHDLSGGVLIKDNHIDALGSIARAVAEARRTAPTTARVEVEVRDLTELDQALAAGADIIMLDNMSPALLREAVARADGRALLEASGNVRAETIRAVAEAGVDFISVGAVTHSVPALDISFKLDKGAPPFVGFTPSGARPRT